MAARCLRPGHVERKRAALGLRRGSEKKSRRVRKWASGAFVEFVAQQARGCVDIRFAQAVQNERPVKLHASQQANIKIVVDSAFARRDKAAVGGKVLGMRDDDLASEQIKRLFPNSRGAREFGQIGR